MKIFPISEKFECKSGLEGNVVKITQDKAYLTLCEVQVWGEEGGGDKDKDKEEDKDKKDKKDKKKERKEKKKKERKEKKKKDKKNKKKGE